MQDVTEALRRKQMTFACYMDPAQPAIVDDEHAVRVNYETFLFADSASREVFRGDVVRFCGLLTDPVSKHRFRPTPSSPVHEDEETDVVWYFEDRANLEMFMMGPEGYRLPGYSM